MFEDVRRVPPGHRRRQRGRGQGDVRVRRPRRAPPGAAPRGHGVGRARLRPAPARRAVEGVVRDARPSATSAPRPAATASTTRSGVEVLGTDDPDLDVEVIALADALLPGPRAAAGRPAGQLHGLHASAGPAYVERAARPSWPSGPTSCATSTGSAGRATPCGSSTARARVPGGRPTMPRASSTTSARRVRAHFARVRGGLDAPGIAYRLEPRLVRGLRLLHPHDLRVRRRGARRGPDDASAAAGATTGSSSSSAARPRPGIGFGIGIERLLLACDAEGCFPRRPPRRRRLRRRPHRRGGGPRPRGRAAPGGPRRRARLRRPLDEGAAEGWPTAPARRRALIVGPDELAAGRGHAQAFAPGRGAAQRDACRGGEHLQALVEGDRGRR